MRRAAYAREALSELYDVESRACPVSTQFVPKIRSFRVHSDEFSIIRRVRRAPARRRGPHSSRAVRGAVSRERKTREIKPENLTNARSGPQKGVKQEDFPGGHPSYYYSRPSTLNSAHGSSYVSSSICTRSSLRALRRGKQGLPRFDPVRTQNSAISGAFGYVFYHSTRPVGPCAQPWSQFVRGAVSRERRKRKKA